MFLWLINFYDNWIFFYYVIFLFSPTQTQMTTTLQMEEEVNLQLLQEREEAVRKLEVMRHFVFLLKQICKYYFVRGKFMLFFLILNVKICFTVSILCKHLWVFFYRLYFYLIFQVAKIMRLYNGSLLN